MPASNVDSTSARELDELMKEYPDWTNDFPEIDKELNPPRYSKNKLYLKHQKTDFIPRRAGSKFPKSAYASTYMNHKGRPRSSKRPPKTPPRHTGLPKMTFSTVQRSEFIPRELPERTKPIIKKENYEQSTEPIDLTTKYTEDFPRKQLPRDKLQPLPHLVPRIPLRMTSSGTFDNRTTTNEHYKKWPLQQTFTFGELPSFTGSILYPSQNMQKETTTGTTFRGIHGRRADPFIPANGNITIEGDMHMDTTHNDVYVPFDGAQPAQKIVNKSMITTKERSKFVGDTQSRRDFPGFSKGQPKPPKPATPPPETIDIKFDKLRSFETEQRKQFPGIDTVQHPMQKSMKKETEEYKHPATKFETLTSQKIDYQPIDLKTAYQPPTAMTKTSRSTDSLPKFDDSTTTKHFFPRWAVPPRQRYGDFHESNMYVPPSDKFVPVTTNQDTFFAKKCEMRPSFKPEEHRLSTDGERYFSTVYDETYLEHSASKRLSKKQAMMLLKALRKRKQDELKGCEKQTHDVVSPRAIAAK